MERGVVVLRRPRGVGAGVPAADRLRGDAGGGAARRACASSRSELLRRRREFSILRVDRADLSKNVLRGFTAFDIFLEQHPEFAERITFTAQLMPSRTDVPEYAEYLEKIEALVAVVNHRHGTPDWMPIDLKLRDDLEEAVASYKHYDVMMVNAMFDGMNLVAKEGPLVNERDGVSILSENTGAHEELGEFALSVNPFDVQELADAIYSALTMSPEARARRAAGLKEIVTSRDPGDWIDEQIADIRAKAARRRAPRRSRRSNAELRAAVGTRASRPRGRPVAASPRLNGPRGGASRPRRRTRPAPDRAPAGAPPRRSGRAAAVRLRAGRAALAAPPSRAAAGRAVVRPAPRRRASAPLRAPPALALAAPPRPACRAAPRPPPPRRRARRGAQPPPHAAPALGAAAGSPRRQRRAARRPGSAGSGGARRGHATTTADDRDRGGRPHDVPPAHASVHRTAEVGAGGRPVRPALLPCAAAWPPKHPSTTSSCCSTPRSSRSGATPSSPTSRTRSTARARSSAGTTGATATTVYEVRKHTEADYHLIQFRGPSSLLEQLDHNLKITDGVLRFRIIKLRPGTPGAAGPAPRRHGRRPRRRPRSTRPRVARTAVTPSSGFASSSAKTRAICARYPGSTAGPTPRLGHRASESRAVERSPQWPPPTSTGSSSPAISPAIPSCARPRAALSVCSLRVACNTRRKDQSTGEWDDKPNYFDVTVWGAQGENCARFLAKGRPVAIDGRLEWREWQDQEGNKRQAIDIIADAVQFLGGRDDAGGGGNGFTPRSDVPADTRDFAARRRAAAAGGGSSSAGDDDIPF